MAFGIDRGSVVEHLNTEIALMTRLCPQLRQDAIGMQDTENGLVQDKGKIGRERLWPGRSQSLSIPGWKPQHANTPCYSDRQPGILLEIFSGLTHVYLE